MIKKIQFITSEERDAIIKENNSLILLEEQNLTEGNFLVFSDVEKLENQIEKLQQDNLILMDALATSFEKILALEAKIDAIGGTI